MTLEQPTDRTARIAGVWYLLVGPPAVFSLEYVPRKLIVAANAHETAARVLAHESLFRLAIVAEILAATFLLMLAMTLYRLFASVTALLAPQFSPVVSRIVLPTLFGELWIMLWLLIKGVGRPLSVAPR